MREEHEPKISLVEIVVITPYLIIIEIVTPFLPLIGDVIAAPVGLYLWFKGAPVSRYLVTALIELFPVVDVLPLYLFGFFLTIFLDRNPALAKATVITAGGVRGAVQGAKGAEGGLAAKAKGAATGAAKGAREMKGKYEAAVEGVEETVGGEESDLRPEPQKKKGDFEKTEVESFGMRPELLSRYELEKTFAPPKVKDIEPPNQAAA